MLTVARYRFQRTFRQRWGAYLSLVLLIGLVGGLSMGALAAARRTESSFPTFLASTNPSNLSLGTALWNPALGYTTGYNGPLVATIARLPHVRRAESYADIYSVPIGANGQPTAAAEKANIERQRKRRRALLQPGPGHGRAGTDGRPEAGQRDHDDRGCRRLPGPPRRADRHLGHLHQRPVRVDGERTSAPALHERLTLVGTVVLNNAVVQDEIDANGPTTVILTPALTRRLDNCCANYSFTYLQLDQGSRDVPAVEAEIERVIPSKLPYDFYDTSIDVTKAQNAIKPEAIALGVFGLIAGLAAILIAGQVIGRQLGFWAPGGAHPARPRRRPRHDRGRRAARDHGRRRGGRAGGRRRRRGALPAGTAGPGASLLSRPRSRLRLDRARPRRGGARRGPGVRGDRARRAAGAAAHRDAPPSPRTFAH